MPFFAWDCLTLHVKNKGDINIIVKNQDVMTKLLKFLIFELETLDGTRGSAIQLIK